MSVCIDYASRDGGMSRRSDVLGRRKMSGTIGINGKFWRLLKHWYSTSSARVRVNGHTSYSGH